MDGRRFDKIAYMVATNVYGFLETNYKPDLRVEKLSYHVGNQKRNMAGI